MNYNAPKVELHILQSFPPSNLNRDDSGAPKDAVFGGHRRARISSQCLKRSIRTSDVFKSSLSAPTGLRTRRATIRLSELLQARHGHEPGAALALGIAAMEAFLSKVDADHRTSVLYYAAESELESLADRLHASAAGHAALIAAAAPLQEAATTAQQAYDDAREAARKRGDTYKGDEKKGAEEAHKQAASAREPLAKALTPVLKAFVQSQRDHTRAADVALFGRMLAEVPELNLDAACQVAHALSVDRVAPEFDYFTAVDDLNPGEETGAGMIGTTGYQSACYYRYAVVDVPQLEKNLSGDGTDATALARETVRAFIAGSVAAIPSGKQNSFAAQTPPVLVMAVVRRAGMPVSLANAFLEPVRAGKRSVAEHAYEALDAHWTRIEQMYGGLLPGAPEPQVFVATTLDARLAPALSRYDTGSVRALLDGVERALGTPQAGGTA